MRTGIECKISLAQKLPITLSRRSLSFDLGSFTNASPRYILQGSSLSGPFAGGTLATRIIGGKRYAQFESARSTENTYSDVFRAAISDWAEDNVTVTDNAIAAPHGLVLADKIYEDSAAGAHRVRQTVSFTSGVTYCFSAFVKAAERTVVGFTVDDNSFPANGGFMPFNLSTESVNMEPGTEDYGFIALDNSWYFLWFTITADATAADYVTFFLNNGVSHVYTGDGSSGLYLFGANVVPAAYLSSYILTDSVPATRAKDQFHWPAAVIPAWLRSGFRTRLIMHQATDEMLASDGGEKIIAAYDTTGAKGVVELYFDGADKKIKWRDDDTGALGESTALNGSLGDVIDLVWTLDNSSNSTLKIDGCGIDTTYTGPQTAAVDGDLYYGMDDSEANQLDIALIAEPEQI